MCAEKGKTFLELTETSLENVHLQNKALNISHRTTDAPKRLQKQSSEIHLGGADNPHHQRALHFKGINVLLRWLGFLMYRTMRVTLIAKPNLIKWGWNGAFMQIQGK